MTDFFQSLDSCERALLKFGVHPDRARLVAFRIVIVPFLVSPEELLLMKILRAIRN